MLPTAIKNVELRIRVYLSMQRIIKTLVLSAAVMLSADAYAQLSSNPDKFLGNITTGYGSDMDHNGFVFSNYWNQVTPENATKWEQVEGTRGQFNWWGADKAYNYATQHGFPFKFHTFVWGSQFPQWFKNLSVNERYNAIVNWMDKAKEHFPNLEMIDVANESVEGHQNDTYLFREALGGAGETGYDWLVKAFEMAHERWPNAILIYNDYNVLRWDTDKFIDIVKTLRDAGAPIDAYGCQAHSFTLNECSKTELQTNMNRIQNELKIPMYITEYDINYDNDATQKTKYEEQIPLFWEADYCAGVTLWGWFMGETWEDYTGLIRNGQERSALQWLRTYMQTNAAKTAKSPFPGMKKEASMYIKPATLHTTAGTAVPINVRASLRTKSLSKVELYADGTLIKTSTTAPFSVDFTPTTKGKHELKAVLTTTDGSKYERLSSITAFGQRAAHNGVTTLPGTLQFEDFDEGGEGFTFHDSDATDEGNVHYRTDNEGVDIVTGNNGYALGYTAPGEWLEYTVNVTQAGTYSYDAYASHGNNVQCGFTVSLVDNGQNTQLCSQTITQTDNNTWATYNKFSGTFSKPLSAGQHILRVTITGQYVNLDKMVLTCTQPAGIEEISLTPDPSPKGEGSNYWFTLDGRKLCEQPTHPGVYINNGKKVVVK